ncbi:MAG: polymorphic toxin-type HINT domain-containing protein [Ignavibacteria bacterium]|nr:polymorphic toxin-type HINT domain-containing protein [Ignavibacteria bacterium]
MKNKKRKLKLEDIKVESFVTSLNDDTSKDVKGAGESQQLTACRTWCDIACHSTVCTDPTCIGCPTGNTCGDTCVNTCDSCPSGCNTCPTCGGSCASVCSCASCNCSCFLEDTLVNTSELVQKAIQELTEGDKVLGFNEVTRKIEMSKVIQVFVTEQPGYYIINKNIKVTENHPFYVNGKWIRVKDIKKGDFLMDKELNPVEVFSIEMINQNTKVYNLEVDNIHTFFVHSILVHNKTICSQAGSCNCPTTDSPLGGW